MLTRSVFLAMCLLLLAAGPAAAGIIGTAALPANQQLDHPDPAMQMPNTAFSVLTAPSMPAGWYSDQSMELASTYSSSSGALAGTIHSKVWRNLADGHLLFAYEVDNNTGSNSVTEGDVGLPAGTEIIDCGLLDFANGTVGYNAGDVVCFSRGGDGELDQVSYWFRVRNSQGQFVGGNLAPGTSSQWFYLETSDTLYGDGIAGLWGASESAINNVQVLVPSPAPEPASLALLAAGAVMLFRRRKA